MEKNINLLESIEENINRELERNLIRPSALISRFRFIEDRSQLSPQATDPTYLPFYYYLGKYVQPRNLLEIGFGLGLCSGCFLKSCKSVEHVLAFQQKNDQYYSSKLGLSNIKDSYRKSIDIHIGNVMDEDFSKKIDAYKWDIVFINEKDTYEHQMDYLELVWGQMSLNGLIVMDHINYHKPSSRAFNDFCKIKNRVGKQFKSRHGTGIIQR